MIPISSASISVSALSSHSFCIFHLFSYAAPFSRSPLTMENEIILSFLFVKRDLCDLQNNLTLFTRGSQSFVLEVIIINGFL